MPNHYTVVGLCARDWKAAEKLGKKSIDEVDLTPINGSNLCKIVLPMPEELQGIVSSKQLVRYKHKITGKVWDEDCNGPTRDHEDWEQVALEPSEIAELERKFGAASWYEWALINYGTKWGTYSVKVHELGGDGSPILIEFQSAWGPPNPEMMRRINEYLQSVYCLSDIKWMGHNPGSGTTEIVKVAEMSQRSE